jgi:hypothetical protein
MRVSPGETFKGPDKKQLATAALGLKTQILGTLAPHDAFTVLPTAYLVSGGDAALRDEDFPMVLELTALLLLERGRTATNVQPEPRIVTNDVRSALLDAKRLVALSIWADIIGTGKRKRQGAAEEALEFKYRLYRRALRKPGTWEQECQLGRMLFGADDIEGLLVAAGAPDIETAIAVVTQLLEQSWRVPAAAMRAEASPPTVIQRMFSKSTVSRRCSSERGACRQAHGGRAHSRVGRGSSRAGPRRGSGTSNA